MPARPTKDNTKPKRQMSAAGRQKLSDLAKQRHAEGRLGGSEFGKLGGRGNTKEKRRAATDIVEAIRDPEMVRLMKKTLYDSQDEDRPMKQRMDGVKLAMEIEIQNEKLVLQESKQEGERLDRGTLLRLLSDKLTAGPTAAAMRHQLEAETIVDATVVEEEAA